MKCLCKTAEEGPVLEDLEVLYVRKPYISYIYTYICIHITLPITYTNMCHTSIDASLRALVHLQSLVSLENQGTEGALHVGT